MISEHELPGHSLTCQTRLKLWQYLRLTATLTGLVLFWNMRGFLSVFLWTLRLWEWRRLLKSYRDKKERVRARERGWFESKNDPRKSSSPLQIWKQRCTVSRKHKSQSTQAHFAGNLGAAFCSFKVTVYMSTMDVGKRFHTHHLTIPHYTNATIGFPAFS